MKTTDTIAFEKDSQKPKRMKLTGELQGPTKSLRPQKSMVRVKSLKPKRMNMIKGVKVKSL